MLFQLAFEDLSKCLLFLASRESISQDGFAKCAQDMETLCQASVAFAFQVERSLALCFFALCNARLSKH